MGIEPTDNPAERDLRSAVRWRKGSFDTRSEAGSRFVSRILSVWASGKKQRVVLIDGLTDALQAAAGRRGGPTRWPA